MQSKPEPKINSANKKSAFEYFTEVVGWLQIMVSPLLLALALGALIYYLNPGKITLVLAIGIVVLGLSIGIIWATKVWKKQGTINFMSSIMSTPELNSKDEDQN